MTNCGSPCGACKFLRRKCVRGCVFGPYFCHENGATHFAAIHKVFGASNVAKILGRLPVSDRGEAAITLSYEAQARVQDPVYGCVSHIFALQQQVLSLQAQLASLKQHANNNMINNSNGDQKTISTKSYPQNVQNWLQSDYPHMVPPFDPNPNCSAESYDDHDQGGLFIINDTDTDNHNSMVQDDDNQDWSSSNHSMAYFEAENKSNGSSYYETDDLHFVAFGYRQYS